MMRWHTSDKRDNDKGHHQGQELDANGEITVGVVELLVDNPEKVDGDGNRD